MNSFKKMSFTDMFSHVIKAEISLLMKQNKTKEKNCVSFQVKSKFCKKKKNQKFILAEVKPLYKVKNLRSPSSIRFIVKFIYYLLIAKIREWNPGHN